MIYSYLDFKLKIEALQSWDTKQLITKNLELKAKPKFTFCEFLRNLFTGYRSKNAVQATQNLEQYVSKFKKELKNDEKTLKAVRNLSILMQERFIAKNIGAIRLSCRRKAIGKACHNIQFSCIKLQKATSSVAKTKYQSLNLTNFKQLSSFLKNWNPETIEEAVFYFQEIHYCLKVNSNINEKLANDLLIRVNAIREKFKIKGEDTQELKETHFNIKRKIRKMFFKDRVRQAEADLQALKVNYASQPKNPNIDLIIGDWEKRIEKMKPFEMPSWYHCTPTNKINSLLDSGYIEVQELTGYKGAFVSSAVESSYGGFCIAMSSSINKTSIPIITRADTSKASPIYTGKQPPYKNNSKPIPTIWAGFQKKISLIKPDKRKNPLGHYAHTNFCMLAFVKDSADRSQLDSTIIQKLRVQRIVILDSKDDFREFVDLVHQTFHCHVPQSWQDEFPAWKLTKS